MARNPHEYFTHRRVGRILFVLMIPFLMPSSMILAQEARYGSAPAWPYPVTPSLQLAALQPADPNDGQAAPESNPLAELQQLLSRRPQ